MAVPRIAVASCIEYSRGPRISRTLMPVKVGVLRSSPATAEMSRVATIGKRVFVGSNTMLVAPVTLGDDSMTASGSVITRDVPATDLSIARAAQVNKPGLALRMFEKLKSLRANKGKGA